MPCRRTIEDRKFVTPALRRADTLEQLQGSHMTQPVVDLVAPLLNRLAASVIVLCVSAGLAVLAAPLVYEAIARTVDLARMARGAV